MSDANNKIRTLVKVFGTMIVLNIIVLSSLFYFSSGVQGNGILKTEPIAVETFDQVTLKGIGTARVTIGEPGFLEVTTDENVFDALSISVENGSLVINNPENVQPSVLLLTIHTPTLSRIDVSGETTIEVPEFRGEHFAIAASGHSAANVAGSADKLVLDVSGHGLIRTKGLITTETAIEVSGSADIEVYASSKLTVNCSGSPKLRYAGKPALDGQCDAAIEAINGT